MLNHTTNVPAVRNDQREPWDLETGEFRLIENEKWIWIGCPCGCGDQFSLPLAGRGKWDWNENRDRPSVAPSIRRMDGCKWHGFLTAGEFKPCGDSGQ